MALFSRKQKKETEKKVVETTPVMSRDVRAEVLRRPRITEKATFASGMSVYVFDVMRNVSKKQIAQAVEQYYKVRPRKVRVVTIPAKNVRNMRTGQRGVTQGGKKAYVYLKKGETITIS